MTDSTPASKQCTKCGKVKPLEEFSPDRRKLDGRVSRCKACAKAYRDAHRDEALAYHKRSIARLIARTNLNTSAYTMRLTLRKDTSITTGIVIGIAH